MDFLLDTADLGAIRELDGMLDIAGITTNPAIITKQSAVSEKAEFDQIIAGIIDYLRPDQKLFVQIVATDFEGMLAEARHICDLRPQETYAKIPVTRTGLRAIKAAKQEDLGVLATAIYSADEAFLAAMNGADYLAPYVNRMCSYGDGLAQVEDLIRMLRTHESPSKVVAASFKSVEQVHELIVAGVDAVTVQPDIVYAMIDHPGTALAVDEFSSLWSGAFGRTTLLQGSGRVLPGIISAK